MPGKPGECKADADCGAGFACFAGGRCLCEPGRRLCRTTCADLDTDTANCGVCGHTCATADTCVQGACRAPGAIAPLSISPLATVGTPFTISTSDGTTQCLHDSEAAPERAAVAGTAHFFTAYSFNKNNWANTYGSWGTTDHYTPDAPNTSVTGGDASATTSDFTGLDYFGYISKRSGDSGNCLGIAVANSDDIASNTFAYDHGVECTAPNTGGTYLDAPTMTYDLGGTDLWAAYVSSGGHDVVQIMEDCKPGQPGCCNNDGSACTSTCSPTSTEQCPVTYNQAPVEVTGARDQPTLAVNPCTHNGIMAYARTVNTDPEIWINVRRPDGTLVTNFEIAGSKAHDSNDVCCNGEVRTCSDDGGNHYCDSTVCSGEPCRRLPAHPTIVIAEVSGTCYAYIAYDASYTSSVDNHRYYTARLGVWDVTDDSSPVWKQAWVSKGGTATYNTYGHEVAAAGPYVAWGFYDDYYGACSTYFDAYVDTNSMLSSSYGYSVAGPFPSMRIYQHPSDWVKGISRGVGPGGQLMLTWEQPVCMNGGYSCDTCGNVNNEIDGCASGQWSHVEKGVVITP